MPQSSLLAEVNIFEQCKKYGLPLWQCPHVLFSVMGILIGLSAIFFYALGTRYVEDPQVVALVVLTITAILLMLAFVITRSFERLAEVHQLKTEFMNIITHQLRSPLSNIKWALDFLTTRTEPNAIDPKEYFQIMKENATRMTGLIQDLLMASRLQENTLQISKERFPFSHLLQTIAKEFEPLLRASNVALQIKGDSSLPELYFDQSQLRHVISNLLDNAIRYSKSAQVEILYQKRGPFLHFEIKDRGIGIPREEQKHIFQKFFRASNSAKYQTEGSGLGLFIAKSIIKKAGGKIGFTSKESKGSTFWFTLPIKP